MMEGAVLALVAVNLLLTVVLFIITTPKKKKRKKYKKRAKKVNDGFKNKKHNKWARNKISKKQKAVWDNYTPEQKKIRLDKMKRARMLKKSLKEKESFNG